MYNTIKPFVHEVTLAKFRFLKNNYIEELLILMDRDQIPVEYGGSASSLDEALN
jgi:hypothetical protein